FVSWRSVGQDSVPAVEPISAAAQSLPSRISDCPQAADRYAVRLVPGSRGAAADCVGRHNAILEVVRQRARLLRRPCPRPMSGDPSGMPLAAAVVQTASGRVLQERIGLLPGRARLSCPATTQPTRESPSFSVGATP